MSDRVEESLLVFWEVPAFDAIGLIAWPVIIVLQKKDYAKKDSRRRESIIE